MNRVTIADVAREAGVSLMTVSRALNKKDDVKPETRQHIMAVVERLGYRPSGVARSLVTRRTGTIGLIVPDVSNPYFSGIAHGVAEISNQKDLSVLLCDTEEESEQEINFLRLMEEKQVDGLIMAAPRQPSEKILPLMARLEHVVVVNRIFEGESNFSAAGYVINDDQMGARLATEHLLSHGHPRVAFLAGPSSSFGSRQRVIGYKTVLEQHQIPCNPDEVIHCLPSVKGGREAMEALLKIDPEISAVFCFNDMVAIGALQFAAQCGRKIPADLEIVGCDDIPVASWVTPALTTCRVLFEEMGRLATRLLVNRFDNCTGGCENIVLSPELIVRDSTR